MSNNTLHGYGLPVNGIADYSWSIPVGTTDRPRFSNALNDWSATPLTLRERSMIAFMGEITDKPDWQRKIFDESILKKWRAERAEKEKTAEPVRALTENMFAYCIQELCDYFTFYEKHGFVIALEGDAAVYKSDSQIPDELKTALKDAVAPLEDVPDKQKDWHPRSDEMVLDLVHPSLFPLLYGRTKILPEGRVPLDDCDRFIGKGEVVPVPEPEHIKITHWPGLSGGHLWGANKEQHYYSTKFQWLPCQVDFLGNDETKISSYINNLHPKDHKPLYKALEKIIAKVVPMWDATLNSTEQGSRPPRIDIDEPEWIPPETERPRGPDEPDPESDDFDEYQLMDLEDDWLKENRKLVMPESGDYSVRESHTQPEYRRTKPINLRKDFADKGLQIIVKLANIHLTPEKNEYEGGTWHIEGQMNEHICASALYYYDNHNITESNLSFREATSVEYLSDKPYEQNDYGHLEILYDIEQDGPATQILGHVNTREGRLLTFPNVFQHRVGSFKLADPTQPGHRKILALFLVDPYTPIPSTAHVPPQQREWWRRMVHQDEKVSELPPELADLVVEAEDYPMELEEAKKLRLELMDERAIFVDEVEERYKEEAFSFCEH